MKEVSEAAHGNKVSDSKKDEVDKELIPGWLKEGKAKSGDSSRIDYTIWDYTPDKSIPCRTVCMLCTNCTVPCPTVCCVHVLPNCTVPCPTV